MANPPGRPPTTKALQPSPHFMEVFDGLLLGDGGLRVSVTTPSFWLSQSERHRDWVDQIERELWAVGLACARTPLKAVPGGRGPAIGLSSVACVDFIEEHRRWYVPHTQAGRRWRKVVPENVRLTPRALAYWFAGDGSLNNKGYSVRLATHGFTRTESEFLLERLSALYGWRGVAFKDEVVRDGKRKTYWALRFSRSDDRVALVEAVRPWVPSCFAHKLRVRISKPCSPEEEARRRNPLRLDAAQVAEIRRRLTDGETFKKIAADFGVTNHHIGRIARAEQWAGGAEPIRRNKPLRRLSKEELSDILLRLLRGESQCSIARLHHTDQARVRWLKRRFLTREVGPRPRL